MAAPPGPSLANSLTEWAGGSRRILAIVFTDVVGSTALGSKLGDQRMREVRRAHFSRSAMLLPRYGGHHCPGREIKTIGDAVMGAFHTAEAAFDYAAALQRNPGHEELEAGGIRAGIHIGTVDIEGDDVFGIDVAFGARIVHEIKDAEIWLSEFAITALKNFKAKEHDGLRWQDRPGLAFKGIAGHHRVWSLVPPPGSGQSLDEIVLGSPPPIRRQATSEIPGRLVTNGLLGSQLDKPSIAVLPFANLSGDPEQEYFTDGMVEEIITALNRIRWLSVIARNSSFMYKGQTVDVKQVGRELGARYLLEGSVRKAGERVRIAAQLIEAETGAHIWADRFEGVIEDIFELQDKVAASVSGVIEPRIEDVETTRWTRHLPNDLTGYDLYLRAHSVFLTPGGSIPQVIGLLDQAIDYDPRYGPGLALAAVCHFLCDLNYWVEDREMNRRRGLCRGRRALQVAGDDPDILAYAALAMGYFGESIRSMIALSDRALTFNPNSARVWHVSSLLRLFAGEADTAITHVKNSFRLSPRVRMGWGMLVIGWASFFTRRFDDAEQQMLVAIQENREFSSSYLCLAACYAHMGRLDEARRVIAQVRAISCFVMPEAGHLRNPDHRDLLLSGLRLAGVETG